jgi:hypothetical protein
MEREAVKAAFSETRQSDVVGGVVGMPCCEGRMTRAIACMHGVSKQGTS